MSERELQLSHVKYLWRDEEAERLTGVDRLVYRSNKLGEDLTLTNTGGGNTSSKLIESDPLTGDPVEVLWVKGSGGDLRTAKRDGFASLYLEKVRAMKPRYLAAPERGPKTPIEDDDVPDVQPLRLQPEPACVLHRYAAPHVRAPPARRSSAPERGHRRRRVGESGAALPGDLRRRRDLRAVAAPGLRHRSDDRAPDRGEPAGHRASCSAITA